MVQKMSVDEKNIKENSKHIDNLINVWHQETEKSKNMQKLITSLFMEVTDMEEH